MMFLCSLQAIIIYELAKKKAWLLFIEAIKNCLFLLVIMRC